MKKQLNFHLFILQIKAWGKHFKCFFHKKNLLSENKLIFSTISDKALNKVVTYDFHTQNHPVQMTITQVALGTIKNLSIKENNDEHMIILEMEVFPEKEQTLQLDNKIDNNVQSHTIDFCKTTYLPPSDRLH